MTFISSPGPGFWSNLDFLRVGKRIRSISTRISNSAEHSDQNWYMDLLASLFIPGYLSKKLFKNVLWSIYLNHVFISLLPFTLFFLLLFCVDREQVYGFYSRVLRSRSRLHSCLRIRIRTARFVFLIRNRQFLVILWSGSKTFFSAVLATVMALFFI